MLTMHTNFVFKMAGVSHKCHTRDVKRCLASDIKVRSRRMPLAQNLALLGLTSKVYVIKGLVVCFVSVFDNKRATIQRLCNQRVDCFFGC